MKQFIYNERVYSDLNSLYKENRKDNLVTLEEFKENIEDNMSIDDALSYRRNFTYNEDYKHHLELIYGFNKPITNKIIVLIILGFLLILNGIFALFTDLSPIFSILVILGGLFVVLSEMRNLKNSTETTKEDRKKIEEIEPIVAQEHRVIEAKIEEELELI